MAELTEPESAYDGDNPAVVSMITLLRIYDVLLAMFTETNEEAAKNLLELHAQGHLMGSSPVVSGIFITDEVIKEDQKPTEPENV